jgi:hypothetical protein
MSSKTSLVFLGLLACAVTLPLGFASANSLGTAGGINGRSAKTAVQPIKATTASKQRQAAALKKKKQQQQAAAAAQAKKAKAAQQQEKKEWYADDRDRGLDVASEYAPDTIAKLRKNNTIAKGDTIDTGNGKKGWRQYLDKYYSR